MNKTFNYEAPEVAIMELETEGVLCTSGTFDGMPEDPLN